MNKYVILTDEELNNLEDGFVNEKFKATFLRPYKMSYYVEDLPEIQKELRKRKNN